MTWHRPCFALIGSFWLALIGSFWLVLIGSFCFVLIGKPFFVLIGRHASVSTCTSLHTPQAGCICTEHADKKEERERATVFESTLAEVVSVIVCSCR